MSNGLNSDAPVLPCTHCGQVKPVAAFQSKPSRSTGQRKRKPGRGYESWCKQCVAQWNKDHYDPVREAERRKKLRAADPQRFRDHSRRAKLRKYGLSEADYDQMVAAQGGVCAICGETDPCGRRLSVDHDHSCCPGQRACSKCVRGLLCGNCNRAIGHLRERKDWFEAAVNYLFG